jgi:hypothetical protein
VVTGLEPLPGVTNPFQIAQRVVSGERPPIPPETPRAPSALIERCWDRDESIRPGFRKIVSVLGSEEVLDGVDLPIFLEYQNGVVPPESIPALSPPFLAR